MDHSRSEQLFARAQKVTPGGVNSPVRAFRGVGGTPRFIARGEGSRLIDVDGNSVDYAGSVRLEGSVKCFAGGTKVASAGFSVGGEIDGNLIRFSLPFLNAESFRLP